MGRDHVPNSGSCVAQSAPHEPTGPVLAPFGMIMGRNRGGGKPPPCISEPRSPSGFDALMERRSGILIADIVGRSHGPHRIEQRKREQPCQKTADMGLPGDRL